MIYSFHKCENIKLHRIPLRMSSKSKSPKKKIILKPKKSEDEFVNIISAIIKDKLSQKEYRDSSYRKIKCVHIPIHIKNDNGILFHHLEIDQFIIYDDDTPTNTISEMVKYHIKGHVTIDETTGEHQHFYLSTESMSLKKHIKASIKKIELFYRCEDCHRVQCEFGHKNKCISCYMEKLMIKDDNTEKCIVCMEMKRKIYNKINKCSNHHDLYLCATCYKKCNDKCPVCRNEMNSDDESSYEREDHF
jgi:hypothetical protein